MPFKKNHTQTNTGRTHFKIGDTTGTKALARWRKNGGQAWNKGKKMGLNPKHSKFMRGLFKGEKSPSWKGGITSQNHKDRTSTEYFEVQKLVFERDNYTCQICFKTGVYLHLDHIQSFAKYLEGRFDINNCRTLCRECHYMVTFKKRIPENSKWGIYKN